MLIALLFEVFVRSTGVVVIVDEADGLIEGKILSEIGIVFVDGNVVRTIGSALSNISSMHCDDAIDVLLLLLLIELLMLLLIFELKKALDTPTAPFESFNKHSEKLPTVILLSLFFSFSFFDEYNKIYNRLNNRMVYDGQKQQ